MGKLSTFHLRTIVCLMLLLGTLVPYWQVQTFDFIHMDDDPYVLNNEWVRRGVTASGIRWAFTSFDAANWHPVTWLSHMLDCQLYGVDPKGHHWTSVQIHAVNTLLLFILLHQMTGLIGRSALVALLFGLHPLHVESVAWIAERKDVLSTFFALLALMAYGRYARRPKFLTYLPVLVLFALGLASKPMVITLPFVMLLLDAWPLRRLGGRWYQPDPDGYQRMPQRTLLALIIEKIPMFVLVILSAGVTYAAQQQGGAVGPLDMISLPVRIANAFVSYLVYLIKVLYPVPLAVFYPHGGDRISWVYALSGATAVLLFTFIAVRHRDRFPYLGVGWLWYIGTLIPVIGLVQVGSQSMADRYTYIPLIGMFIIFAWGAFDLFKSVKRGRLYVSVLLILYLPLATAHTHRQVSHWENSITLFRHAAQAVDNNWLAHNNLGSALDAEGRLDEAIVHIEKALSIHPLHVDALYNRAMAYQRQGEMADAMLYYRKALSEDPAHVDSHINLAVLLADRGQTDAAVSHYAAALSIEPKSHVVHNNLGVLYVSSDQPKLAAQHFNEAIHIHPGFADAHYNLGALLKKKGDLNGAFRHFGKALAVIDRENPREVKDIYADLYFDMGVRIAEKGEHRTAVRFFEKSLEINPAHTGAATNLKLLQEMIDRPAPY